MKLSSRIKFADDETRKAFDKLKNDDYQDKKLLNSLNKAFDNLENDIFNGIQVSKRLIPKEYVKKYNISNLWKYNLSGGWRLIYSVESEEIIVLCVVLEWLNHKEYERRFKYYPFLL